MIPSDTMTGLGQRIQQHLDRIGAIGREPEGWSRLAFSSEEDAVHEYAAGVLEQLGCQISRDAFGNLTGMLPGSVDAAAPVMLGTHLDTVRNGGNYDGVVGFIVAVEAVRELLGGGSRPNLVIAVFRAEESTRFQKACLGSRAAFLGLDGRTLKLSGGVPGRMTITLAQAVSDAGGAPDRLAQPTLGRLGCQAYFETHIEQARVLELVLGLDGTGDLDSPPPLIGIVTSIRAPHRCEWEVSGPRSVGLFARCVIATETAAVLANRMGLDAVATVGRVDHFFHGADKINAVPGRVEFPLVDLSEEALAQAGKVAAARGCRVEAVERNGARSLLVLGTTDHSGGTPMGIENRQDALVAASEIVVQVQEIRTAPCDRIVFGTDVRSNSTTARDFVSRLLDRTFEAIEGLTEGAARVEKILRTELTEPLQCLNSRMQEMIATAARDLGIRVEHLPSGAGHDAMMAAISGVPTAMMFIPSKGGLSHNPQEWSRNKDIAAAIQVQAQILRKF